ncbi:MAG: hypothetical protein ACP5DX_12300 [Paracoccaceae bacterium]|jgi:hypothetical protein
MSDPVKTEDIEDVLSSIRRLVSEEPGGRAPLAADMPSQPGKLVLTPAFRVADEANSAPAAAEEEAAPDPEGAPLPEAGAEDALPTFIRAAAAEAVSTEPATEVWDESSLRERVAELEAAVAESGGDWEPDGSEDAPETVPLARVAARDEEEKAEHGAEAPEPGAEEAVLDEEALRDMVADIVRRELQGEMGQRITRNVRKLVRQEINRALASRDLE